MLHGGAGCGAGRSAAETTAEHSRKSKRPRFAAVQAMLAMQQSSEKRLMEERIDETESAWVHALQQTRKALRSAFKHYSSKPASPQALNPMELMNRDVWKVLPKGSAGRMHRLALVRASIKQVMNKAKRLCPYIRIGNSLQNGGRSGKGGFLDEMGVKQGVGTFVGFVHSEMPQDQNTLSRELPWQDGLAKEEGQFIGGLYNTCISEEDVPVNAKIVHIVQHNGVNLGAAVLIKEVLPGEEIILDYSGTSTVTY